MTTQKTKTVPEEVVKALEEIGAYKGAGHIKAVIMPDNFQKKHIEKLEEIRAKHLENIRIEILGDWIWITGPGVKCYQWEQIFKMGFKWSEQKEAFYLPTKERRSNKIRAKYTTYTEVQNKWKQSEDEC